MYRILFAQDVKNDLKKIPAFHRLRVLDDIDKRLRHQPSVQTKNTKLLVNLLPPWEATSVVWELRSGEYRVFYDVEEDTCTVYVRAVRRKLPGKTTEEIL